MQTTAEYQLLTTDTININVVAKIKIEGLIDLMDSVPQAISYWVRSFQDIHYTQASPAQIYSLTIVDEETKQEYLISVNTIIEGIKKLVSGKLDVQERYIGYAMSDLGQGLQGGYIDSETLDLIIQAGLFGKVLYG
jgi:hypothetical protein